MNDQELQTLEKVSNEVCFMMGVSLNDLQSKSRLTEFVTARAMVATITRRNNFYVPLKKLGAFLGGRTHATIINNVEVAEIYLKTDKAFKINHDAIIKNLTTPDEVKN